MIEIKYPCEDGYIYMRFEDDGGLFMRRALVEDIKAHTVTEEQAFAMERILRKS